MNDLVPGGDAEYFAFHARRFRSHLESLTRVASPGARVLDIGSHYLHLSSALAEAGYIVTALDVPEFQRLDFVQRRAMAARVRTETITDLGRGEFLEGAANDSYDVIVFCEILEHITFNPVRFWRRVYDLLAPGGLVFLSTPNSLRLTNTLKTAYRLFARRGVGICVADIFGAVTYGHHWKEYSAPEIREYFARLSPDFDVSMRFVDYELKGSRAGVPVRIVGGVVPSLRPHIEAIARLPRKTQWLATEKRYED